MSIAQQIRQTYAERLKYKKWVEEEHPRDDSGKFTSGGGHHEGTKDDRGFHKSTGSTGGGLGIKRTDMPQIKGEDKPEFFNWLTKRGVMFMPTKKKAADLEPTQADLNEEKMGQMADAITAGTFSKGTPPLVSSDGYVLDGHHRWGAYKKADDQHQFDVVVVDQPIRELLETVREFPKAMKVDADGNRTKYSAAERSRARYRRELAESLRYSLHYGPGWDESKHPRGGKGTQEGGRFVAKGDSGTPTQEDPQQPQPQQPAQPTGFDPGAVPQNLQSAFASIEQQYGATNPNGIDTQQKYMDQSGNYSPQRQQLHSQIIENVLGKASKPPAGQRPVFTFMGGGPAAGKSSIVDSGSVQLPEGHALIDPDGIKAQLPEYQAGTNGKWTGSACYSHEESSDLSKRVMSEAARRGVHAVLDGTGDSGYDKLAKKVAQARAHGHTVNAEYVTVNTDEAVRRSMARAAKTGRMVPEDVIRGTHAMVSKIVPLAIADGLFDNLTVWDTEVGPGEKPVAIATAKGKQLQVHDPQRWQNFLDKGK